MTTLEYSTAFTAQKYAATKNPEIMNKATYAQRKYPIFGNEIKIHKIANGDFGRAVKRHVFYTVGNGASLPQNIKDKIDGKIDEKINSACEYAKIDGIVWGFPTLKELKFYRIVADEGTRGFIVMLDEWSSKPMAAIAYWQLDSEKPVYVELFEIEGMTGYKKEKGKNFEEFIERKSYRSKIKTYPNNSFPKEIEKSENYGYLPIFPLRANDSGTSEFTNEIHGLADALDFVSSAICDDVTLTEGLYTILKKYGGDNELELKSIIEESKLIMAYDDVDAGAKFETVESPFQAKQFLLGWIENRLNKAFMLPDDKNVRGVTATEIKSTREPMDIKADEFEPHVISFLENVLELHGINQPVPDYKRRTNSNDTELVNNISTMKADGYIDNEEAIELNPLLAQERKDKLIGRLDVEALKEADNTFPIENTGGEENGQSA